MVEPSKKSGGWGSGNSPGLLRDPRSKSPTWGSSSPVVHTANNNSSSSWGSAVPREKISWGSDQPASAPSEPSPSISNTFQGQGFLPSKTMGVPCVVLTNWFTKKPHCIQISKKQFVTWHDDGRPHLRRFTAVFVCPVTGEVFPSGRYGDDPSVYELRRDEATGADVIWFSAFLRVLTFFVHVGTITHFTLCFLLLITLRKQKFGKAWGSRKGARLLVVATCRRNVAKPRENFTRGALLGC